MLHDFDSTTKIYIKTQQSQAPAKMLFIYIIRFLFGFYSLENPDWTSNVRI